MSKITPVLSENAMTVLCKRYLRPLKPLVMHSPTEDVEQYEIHKCQKCGKSHETPQEMFERCSFGREDFYNLLASLDFLPNSPTLFNAGTNQGTFSGCFKFDVEDTMDSILEVARKAALVLKWGGGTGFYLGKIRPKDSLIHTTHGKACGPVAVLEYYHAGALLITQSGKRQAAQMGMLDCDHPDIREFIHCKDGGKNLSTFNISVSCTDTFMQEALKPGTEQQKLFDEMVDSAWRTGDPGLYFVDTAERENSTPWLGKLNGTNACGEVPLLNNEACNLGSINLSHMVKDSFVDWAKLRDITRLAVQYLDTVVDNNHFPVKEIEDAVLLTRKIGLGVMGWADMLALLQVHYNTEQAVELANDVMEYINDIAHEESKSLGISKGICPAFQATSLSRNAAVTCIAPAGSICTIADCSSGIEPHYSLDADRVMGDGVTHLTENVRVDTKGFIPHVAHEIDPIWHVRHQAAFQAHTDLAVSKTVNLRNEATRDSIRAIFIKAWELKCKGVTVYRDGSRNVQVLKDKTSAIVDMYPTDKAFGARRRKMPKDATAYRHSFTVGGMEGYLHIGLFDDKTPGELFITGSNQGSTVSGLLASLSIMTSLALQYDVPLQTMVSKLQNIRFEPAGLTDNPEIPTASSIVAYIYRYFGKKCLPLGEKSVSVQTGMLCPECGAPAITEEGCMKCSKNCGWSRC